MTINHINLIVTNVSESISFFENFFGFSCISIKGDNVIAVLRNTENFTLVLATNKNDNTVYPKNFHIGFMLDTIEQVDELHKKLKFGNIEVGEAPKKIRDSYGFYFHIDNLFIEVGHY